MNTPASAECGFLISAPWRSSGKTLVSVGLAHEARRQQLAVQTYKKGPDYIDPLWLGGASGVPCYNLDPWVQQPDEIISTYRRQVQPGTLTLVEGTMGLHDGMASDGSDSNAAIAKLLGLKVVLVIDCRGMHRTIAALVNGLQQFDPDVQFAGVILNRIRSERHGNKIRIALREYSNLAVLGELPESEAVHIAEKQLGLVPAPEFANSSRCIESMANLVRDHCDLPGLFRGISRVAAPVTPMRPCRAAYTIGIARDEAFHFYYQDDLDTLRALGAELKEISPLRDPFPADLDGLLIGGGFPERYAVGLSQNTGFRRSLNAAIAAGLPVHAECAGLMYLCRTLRVNNEAFAMAGVFDATVTMREKAVGRGYVNLLRRADDGQIAAHEFHHSTAEFNSQPQFAYAVQRGYGIDGEHDGVCHLNAHASYAHFRHTRQCPWVNHFITRVANHKTATMRQHQ